MSILCTICARGNSKGVTNKALRLLNNKPLIAYTVEQALDSKVFDRVVLSTDSQEIAENAKTFGVERCFIRSKELSTDSASKISAIRNVLLEAERFFRTKFDIIVDLDITSPLRNINDIQNALKHFIDTKADNLITVCPSKKNPYFNMVEITNGQVQIVKKPKKQITRRQDAPKTYEMNASIYIWKREALLFSDDLFTDKTCLYEMLETQSIDVDTRNDLDIVQFLLKKKNDE